LYRFLTQTRPDVEEPEIYQPSSPATAVDTSGTPETFVDTPQSLLGPQSSQSSLRRPLRTLSFTKAVPLERSPERSPLVRLAKRTRTPPPRSKSPSPSNSPTLHRKKNAFDVLRQQAPRPKQVLKKSEFVAEEAQESDDDEMVAFGGKQKDDDGEEDGEDLDRTLETLVDDQEMGEDVVAADRVLEKFQFVFSCFG
jgi:mediator of replication checkpoint protein 1